jgi:hypothetical protein
MCIVSPSGSVFYSPFLALPAPKIAGLLPAPKPEPPPTFTYRNPDLATMSEQKRDALFAAATLLLDVAVAHQAGAMSDHALHTALAAFRKAVTGKAAKPMNPAQFAAQMDVPLLEFVMETRRGDTP